MRTVMERFWLKVEKTKTCWVWTGAIDTKGYGKINIAGKMVSAHRLSWEMATGERPAGWVLHECDNPSCVRPSHLHLGDGSLNQKERVERGRHNEAKKTHCKWGHPFDEANTYWRAGSTGRGCRTCSNLASLKYYPKRGHPKRGE